MGDTSTSGQYGKLTFELDGEVVEPQTIDTSKLGTNGKISARMWYVPVENALRQTRSIHLKLLLQADTAVLTMLL